MFAISAINENESSRSESLAPTKEAQEFHLTKLYNDGLESLHASDFDRARNLFMAIIQDPLSIKAQKDAAARNDLMLRLRFLTYRNLAETYAKQGPEFSKEALQSYIQAVKIDDKDVVLWNRLGTVAYSLGKLNIARHAFEKGLLCSPRHYVCMEKLIEVLVDIGDESGCLHAVERLLAVQPSHPRALHMKTLIKRSLSRELSSGITGYGIDLLGDESRSVVFVKKRKSEEVSRPKKRIQHSLQLSLSEPTWSALVKTAVDAFRSRELGKISKSEELKDRGSYLANSRVIFSMKTSDADKVTSSSDVVTLADPTSGKEPQSAGDETPALEPMDIDEKGSSCKPSENGEHHERRSTRLERLRSRKSDKCDDAMPDCPRSLMQSLEPFVLEHVESKGKDSADAEVSGLTAQRRDGCLVCSNSSRFKDEEIDKLEAEEVARFMNDCQENCGLYHVVQELLARVSKSGMSWKDHTGLFELEKCIRKWDTNRSLTCSLFLAELYLDAAATAEASEVPAHLNLCNFNICNVFQRLAIDVEVGQTVKIAGTNAQEDAGFLFWTRFCWLNGRYCMAIGNSKKGFEEFRKCLALLQAQPDVTLILPHCKVDNNVSLKTVEQKLYEFEVGDLLSMTVIKLESQGKFSEVVDTLVPVLFSDRATKSKMWSSGKCMDALQSNEFNALTTLIAACQQVQPSNLPVQLRCHLRKLEILCQCAGILSPRSEDDLPPSPASGSPTSAGAEGDKHKEIKLWSKSLGEEVKHLLKCATALKNTLEIYRSEDLPLGRVQHVLLTILTHYGSVFSKRHSNLNLAEQGENSFIVQVAVAFCRMQHLSPGVPPERQVALIVKMHEILAERGICGAGPSSEDAEGSFLRMAIRCLLTLDTKLKQQYGDANAQEAPVSALDILKGSVKHPDGGPSQKNEELERIRTKIGLDAALDQCFFCLYGLNLKADFETGSSDNVSTHRTTACADFQTKEQSAAVLQYVLPYAKSNSKAGLAKLRQILQAIRKQFPQPPCNVLVGNVIDKFLDDLQFDEAKLSEMVMSRTSIGEILSFAFPKQEEEPIAEVIYTTPGGEVRAEEAEAKGCTYAEVYQNLYYLLTQVEDMSMSDKVSGFVLTKEGEDLVEQNASLYKYDLLYNMLRFESWHKLAGLYDEEVDSLLNDGSRNVNAQEWRKNSRLTSRVENSRRRSRRCFMMSLALANETQQYQIHDMLALVYYDTVQNTAPTYDQRSFVQQKDASWISRCLNATKHFEAAYSRKPEWTHLYFLGKLSEKLGKPSEESFSFYKRARDLHQSALDPLYRLHRSRLKLLCKGRYHDLEAIEAVAKFCFHTSSEEIVNNKLSALRAPEGSIEGSREEERNAEIAAVWRLLFKDCMLAMQACIEGDLKHFHKARFSIAQGLYLRAEEGDWEKAKEELAFCFRSSRSLFTINMWELDGVVKKNKRKATGSTHAKKTLELGLPESARKFITCVRKYLLLYMNLCEKAGDIVTLERAYSTIRIDKRFSTCLEDISNVTLASYVHALGGAITQAEKSGCVNNSTLQGLLERMFNLFMDHGLSWPEEAKSSDIADKTVICYIHRYLHYLENDCRVDALELVNERIRRRFKSPKASGPHFSQICRHATLAWCRALSSALSSVTPLEKSPEQPSHLVVDLQYDVLFCSPYDADILGKISQVSVVVDQAGSASAAYISRIRTVPVVQVSPENAEKAQSYLRATFVFYREVTSGPFPNGINLFVPSLSGSASEPSAVPGFELLDLSTPRKLLMWAYALVHGRAAGIGDVVKYCEEQAKTRLKKWPSAPTHNTPPAPALAITAPERAPSSAVSSREQSLFDMDLNKQEPPPVSHDPAQL